MKKKKHKFKVKNSEQSKNTRLNIIEKIMSKSEQLDEVKRRVNIRKRLLKWKSEIMAKESDPELKWKRESFKESNRIDDDILESISSIIDL